MKDSLKTFPQDGKWMSAYKWKERIKKQLIAHCVTVSGKPQLETTITVREILGDVEK